MEKPLLLVSLGFLRGLECPKAENAGSDKMDVWHGCTHICVYLKKHHYEPLEYLAYAVFQHLSRKPLETSMEQRLRLDLCSQR